MLERWQRRLVLINIMVFLAVLSIFCGAVYFFGCSAFDHQLRDKIVSIADSAISSIDFDDYGEAHNGKPDLIVSELGDEASPAIQNMRLQWFDPQGKLDIEKGSMAVNVPLELHEGFQQQEVPAAVIFTKPAFAEGKLLGYVRVGHPLNQLQRQKELLLQCLIFGSTVAITAGGIGVYLLVRQSLKPLEESIQHLKQFCADAAHELRNPIAAISTNSSVALRHPDGMRDGDRIKFEAITSGAQQLEKLTEDLLTLARAEQLTEQKVRFVGNRKQADLAGISTELNRVVQSVFEQVDAGAAKKKLILRNEVPETIAVSMDRDDIDCVLRNLIDNAIKYTPDEGSIVVSASAVNGSVRLTVADDGIGIDSEDLPKVFERFWRADKVRSHHSAGNGLGLPIVKAIVEKHGGTIAVTSEPGKGTTFKMQLKGG